MIQPVKNFVKLKDYYTFLLRQSVVWNNLKTHFIKEQKNLLDLIELEKNLSEPFFAGIKGIISPKKVEQDKKEVEDLADKLLVVQRRLDLLLAEYNRVEYYSLYKFDQIELPPELATTFFDYAVQEMKSEITYH